MANVKVRLVGPKEIAVLHCSPVSTAWRWRGRESVKLPEPSWRVSGHDLWELDVIELWSRDTWTTGRYTRWQAAIGKWARHLGRMVPDGHGGLVPDPTLTFAVIYDLLGLGQVETRLGEVGMPEREAVVIAVDS